MKKMFSLIKVSLNHDMNIFKINTRNQNKFRKIGLPLFLTLYIMSMFFIVSRTIIDVLIPIKMEFVLLTLFAFFTSILTFTEGIYKSSSLLFNCKDDDLLLSLPITKGEVLFIRIFKFYVFELLYNSLFLLPSMITYAINVPTNWTYYLSSITALLILPIVPVALSCIFGFIVTYLSSKFKRKNLLQTIFTIIIFFFIFYFTSNANGLINNLATKAVSINDFIIKLYYPVGAYIKLITDFNIKDLLLFILINGLIFAVIIFALGKIYFGINSSTKRVFTNKKNKNYCIKKNSPIKAIIKKELNRFFKTPVYLINTGIGLILFLIACIGISLKYNDVVNYIMSMDPTMTLEQVEKMLPVLMMTLVSFASLMTSITSSTISLEGKSFNILKSLPIKETKIIKAKILAALCITLPCLLLGDLIVFIRFKFDFISILLILIVSIILPILSGVIGMISNLKFPIMDAVNDTQVVKQSMSVMISVFVGIGIAMLISMLSFEGLDSNIPSNIILLIITISYTVICSILILLLSKRGEKYFNNISV